MATKLSRFQRLREDAQALLRDHLPQGSQSSRFYKFIHFWVLVGRSFTRNRCPIRASALAYATLLALIPMLAVVMSITSSFLKNEGEERIDEFIIKMVASVTPPALLNTNVVTAATNVTVLVTNVTQAKPQDTNSIAITNLSSSGPASEVTNVVQLTKTEGTNKISVVPSFAQGEQAIQARRAIAREIHHFIQNTRSGALGVTGSVLLIFAAISMLSRIESTFNDIWGVARGRGWFTRIVLYWGVISLAPLLLVVVVGLANGPHFSATKQLLETTPFIGHLLFQFVPVFVLCLTFAAFYMLIPNTRVQWLAALAGGIVGGLLFHLNSMMSVVYVSRVVSNSKIYGGLALVPVFMIGLYFAWLILLFGAQVAYAFQNRATYLEEKQVESINQRGREFIALRLMTLVGQRFLQGAGAPGSMEMAEQLGVPTKLVQQVLQTLCAARLLAETSGLDCGYVPARPLEGITCHDILLAMRSTHGQEFATRDEPVRAQVYGEFHRIEEAERQAAASVTLLALASRAQAQLTAGEPSEAR
jgi:membrane protein